MLLEFFYILTMTRNQVFLPGFRRKWRQFSNGKKSAITIKEEMKTFGKLNSNSHNPNFAIYFPWNTLALSSPLKLLQKEINWVEK